MLEKKPIQEAPELVASEVVDEAALLARVEGDTQLLREIVSLFMAECPKMIDQARKALMDRDAKALERASHALKGTIGNFAAEHAYEAAQKLEMLARAGEWVGADVMFRDLEAQVERLKSVLTTLGTEVAP